MASKRQGMAPVGPQRPDDGGESSLQGENELLRAEIRVAREAARITARMVVTQFEKTEAALNRFRETSGQLQAVLDAAGQISVVACDLQGRIILFNRGAELLLGYSAAEATRRLTIFDLHSPEELQRRVPTAAAWFNGARRHRSRRSANGAGGRKKGNGAGGNGNGNGNGTPDTGPNALHALAGAVCQDGLEAGEWRYVRKNGTIFPVHLSLSELRDENDRLAGYLSVGMDITERQRLEENLRRNNEELQRLDSLKSDFLSSVSHELRTPLTSIRGFVALVEKEFSRTFIPLAEEHPKASKKAARITANLQIVQQETERLTRLINNVLDLAKIEAGRVDWEESSFPLADALNQAVSAVKGQYEQKVGVGLQVRLAPDLPVIRADRDRLVQVVVNLLNNAAKFTERGRVQLRAEVGGREIKVAVEDSGVGFDSADAEAVFDKFRQVSQGDTLTDKPAGTGLGLPICKEIIEHYGGRIWAESAPGQGSTFYFSLPETLMVEPETAAAGAKEPELAPAKPVAGREAPLILVVDDEPAVRGYLSQFFQESGFRVISAADGRRGLDLARRHTPDLITMDLVMPGMSGQEAITALRRDRRTRRIPILVISVLSLQEQRQAGGDLVLAKPVDEKMLLNSVALLMARIEPLRVPGPLLLPDASSRCLLLSSGRQTTTPELLLDFAGEIEHCSPRELEARLAAGFQGMLVIPAEMIGRIDIHRLNGNEALQILVLPPSSQSGEK